MFINLIKVTLVTLLVVYIAVGLLLYVYQDKLLYHPTANAKTKYSNIILHQDGADVMVHVLNEGKSDAILYFGGNAESMAASSDYIAKQFPDFTCYLMDYRGYGGSSGKPKQNAIYSDALALYNYVAKKHNKINIGGRSLGTGVATYVASKKDVNKLALITPYDSIEEVAQERYPIYPANLLLKDKYNSIANVKNIKAKTFIVIAQNDKVIPLKHTKNLIKAFKKDQLKVETIKGRGHNDISDDERYYKVMQNFIRQKQK